MEVSLIKRIDALRIHLTTSTPVKLQEVVDTWNEFVVAIGMPKARKQPTGCISCIRNLIKDMVKHIDRLPYTNLDTYSETEDARKEDAMPAKEDETKTMKKEESTAKPHKKKGRRKF